MSGTTTPALLPPDTGSQDAKDGERLVARWVHARTCALRRGHGCTCMRRYVLLRPDYARRYEGEAKS